MTANFLLRISRALIFSIPIIANVAVAATMPASTTDDPLDVLESSIFPPDMGAFQNKQQQNFTTQSEMYTSIVNQQLMGLQTYLTYLPGSPGSGNSSASPASALTQSLLSSLPSSPIESLSGNQSANDETTQDQSSSLPTANSTGNGSGNANGSGTTSNQSGFPTATNTSF